MRSRGAEPEGSVLASNSGAESLRARATVFKGLTPSITRADLGSLAITSTNKSDFGIILSILLRSASSA